MNVNACNTVEFVRILRMRTYKTSKQSQQGDKIELNLCDKISLFCTILRLTNKINSIVMSQRH